MEERRVQIEIHPGPGFTAAPIDFPAPPPEFLGWYDVLWGTDGPQPEWTLYRDDQKWGLMRHRKTDEYDLTSPDGANYRVYAFFPSIDDRGVLTFISSM
jgi:hypothetical protein